MSNVRLTDGFVPPKALIGTSSGAAFCCTVADPSGSTGGGSLAFAGASSVTTWNDPAGGLPPQFVAFCSAGCSPGTSCVPSALIADPVHGSRPGSVGFDSPPRVTENPTHASHHRMLTHTCPSRC